MIRASVVEITPKGRTPYYIVTAARRPELCRRFTDARIAIAYQRQLRAA